jgi:hypothetical protein
MPPAAVRGVPIKICPHRCTPAAKYMELQGAVPQDDDSFRVSE